MTDKRRLVVEAAKSFIGAKWKHQGRLPTAMDCAGLIALTGIKAGVIGSDFQDFTNYDRTPDGKSFKQMFDGYGIPILFRDAQDGDVVIFGRGTYNFHCGILFFKNSKPHMVHAYADTGIVMETPLTAKWMRLHTFTYKYKEVD